MQCVSTQNYHRDTTVKSLCVHHWKSRFMPPAFPLQRGKSVPQEFHSAPWVHRLVQRLLVEEFEEQQLPPRLMCKAEMTSCLQLSSELFLSLGSRVTDCCTHNSHCIGLEHCASGVWRATIARKANVQSRKDIVFTVVFRVVP